MRAKLFINLLAILLVLWMSMDSLHAGAPPSQRIEILAWMGPPATVDRLKEMADAGFTISFNNFADVNAALAGLDAAKAAGVRLMVSCPQLQSDTKTTVERLKSHPALAGYFLRDEPDVKLFPELAKWLREVRAADAKHDSYINLFPNYATAGQLGAATYQDYLDAFVKTVPIPYLSFDHYPVIQSANQPAMLRPQWYENLEQASAVARRVGLPLWAFALSTRHYNYPTPTLAHLRVQVFSDLAYGAQTIQYFTYWQVGGNNPPFDDAPVAQDGKQTVVYDRVKQVNQEIRGLEKVFTGAKVVAIGHTGQTIPQGTHRYEPQAPVKAIQTQGAAGSGAFVSLLSKDDHRYLVVVNRDINARLSVSLSLDDSPAASSAQRIEKDGSVHALGSRSLQVLLEPGDVAVFTWPQTK